MTTSQRSNEVYVVDIPEVKGLTAQFRYNFYLNDEGVTEDTHILPEIMYRDAPTFESYLKYASEHTPRYVVLRFSPTFIPSPARSFDYTVFRVQSFKPSSKGVISKNLDKVIDEDHFSANGFTAVQFHDGDLASKSKDLVSASMLQHMYVEGYDDDISDYRKANRLSSRTPNFTPAENLTKAVSVPASPQQVTFTSVPSQTGLRSALKVSSAFQIYQSIDVHTQINNKVLYDLVDAAVKNPTSTAAADFLDLHATARKVQTQAVSLARTSTFSKFNLKHIDVQPFTLASQKKSGSEIVGYIIDKIEILPNGKVKLCDPIVVENPHMGCAVDFNVRYGAIYMYAVRAVAQTTLAAVDDESDELVSVTVLLSSKPSNKVFVDCQEYCPPAPPTDLNFRWDYGFHKDDVPGDTGRLIINWTFPPNAQRDIKKFQVFRRRTVDEPFVLVKEYDFNDNQSPLAARERPLPGVSEKRERPRIWYYDPDFRKDSKFIYAVASIDAHELSSGYSDQFMVSFDVYKNRLVKSLVSHSGAPKPYPNMYLEGDTFIDAVVDEGHDRVRVYFNPEFFSYTRNDGKPIQAFETIQTGGEYRLQFISLSAQDTETLTIKVNDQRPTLFKNVVGRLRPVLSTQQLSKILKVGQ